MTSSNRKKLITSGLIIIVAAELLYSFLYIKASDLEFQLNEKIYGHSPFITEIQIPQRESENISPMPSEILNKDPNLSVAQTAEFEKVRTIRVGAGLLLQLFYIVGFISIFAGILRSIQKGVMLYFGIGIVLVILIVLMSKSFTTEMYYIVFGWPLFPRVWLSYAGFLPFIYTND